MNTVFILIFMFFCHCFDDYVLQGCLANLKQKKWWIEHASNKKYKNDYIMGLLCHSISWTFMITLPIAINTGWFTIGSSWILLFTYPLNIAMHAFVDDLKANKLQINLIQDQLLHFMQIILTWSAFILIMS